MDAQRQTLMVTVLITSFILAVSPRTLSAQERRDVQISGGLAVSFSPTDQAGGGTGASLLVDYVFAPAIWGGGQLYAGAIFSGADAESCSTGVEPCAVSSQIGVLGAKVRLLAPVPYVGPFLELGAGVSVGSIETRLGGFGSFNPIDEDHSGIMFHVPVTLGLAIGARHQHEVSFAYFAHPGREHVAGAVQLGIGFSWH